MELLKALIKFNLPEITEYRLNNIPEDSELVRVFLSRLNKNQKELSINWESNSVIEVSKYLSAIKSAASKVTEELAINYWKLTVQDLWEIISVSKKVKKLFLWHNLISIDNNWDFGSNMEGCAIEFIDFGYTGNSEHCNWGVNQASFNKLKSKLNFRFC